MKKALLLAVLVLCGSASLWAQKLYFVYIQSDTNTPFYLKMSDKVFSSSASGYLILSRLKDSTYTFQIGPSANESELSFTLPVQQADHGFLLKKFAEEGWALFNLQTMKMLLPTNKSTGLLIGERVRDDRFTDLLAIASGDTSLYYQPAVSIKPAPLKKEPKEQVVAAKPTAEPQRAKIDSAIVTVVVPAVQMEVKDSAMATVSQPVDSSVSAPPVVATAIVETDKKEKKTESAPPVQEPVSQVQPVLDTVQVNNLAPDTVVAVETAYKRSKVIRRSESSTVDGFGLVFWDDIDGVVDTIKIFIPNQKMLFSSTEATVIVADTAKIVQEPVAVPVAKKVTEIATCNGQASEKDFFRLRKNLVEYENEKEMVTAAKGGFRKKCFTAGQIKNLSSLFLTQEGKWLFLEAAYPFVSDKDNFTSLQSELFEEAYLARFKTLVGK